MHYTVDERPSINPSYLCYVSNPRDIKNALEHTYWSKLVAYFEESAGIIIPSISSIVFYENEIQTVFTKAHLMIHPNTHKGMSQITAEQAYESLFPPIPVSLNALFTPQENEIMELLLKAHYLYTDLPVTHDSLNQEWVTHLHGLQHILSHRILQRICPDYFTNKAK